MEDFSLVFPLSFQQVYKDVDGRRSFGVDWWGGQGGGVSFGNTDGLRASVFVFLALGSVVAGELAMEASSFTDALGPFGGGKFR